MAIQRADIYLVDLNPVQGREQSGRRPVLVLSVNAINRLPLVVTVVIGRKGENVARLSDQCPHPVRRKRPADGNRLSLLPASLTRSLAICWPACRKSFRSHVERSRDCCSPLSWLVSKAAALGRVIVFDAWKLETIYRVLSFMALGIVLLVLGFFYNKYQDKIRQWL